MVKVWDRVVNLFGVEHCDETDGNSIQHQNAWLERRKRFLDRRCGQLTACDDQSNRRLTKQSSPARSATSKGENIDRQSRRKRHQPPIMVSESKNANIMNIIKDARLSEIVFRDDDDDDSRRHHLSQTKSASASAATARAFDDTTTATTATTTNTNVPTIIRTTSDTAIHHTTVKPQYLQYFDEDRLSEGSYDLTDFEAKESVVKLVNDVLSRSEPRRAFGIGLVGNLLSRKFRKDLTYAQLNAIYSFNDHRPFFTYWVTTVQILIMIITLFTYGFGPFGLSETLVRGLEYVSSLSYHTESYYEKDNIWLGPRSSDLIHLGAKFTPCMRRDFLIYKEINLDREEEKLTGCCVRKHDPTCLQTTKEACTSIWLSWNESTVNDAPMFAPTQKRRVSGPVCGQDPRYCLTPASKHPHEWPDDITQWPICQEHSPSTKPLHHTSCEVAARPCCFGIHGQCRIITSQHCQFLRGTFHPEATLCSQISCMEDVCGMVPFYARDYPDQFYRLFTALFLHAGLIHLSLTVALQYYIMRDIERLLGSTRMAIIYILPGVAGYLASATFVPYHTQVGPSGSQFALLACLIAELINSWKLLDDPITSLWKLISIAIGLFILGLLPWIDNYAHIFGFFVGLMLSLALTPYLTPFNDAYSRRKKLIQIWICIILVILTFVLLPLPLYIFPLYKCSWCQYLDCWPLTPNWCENQDIKLTRKEYIL